MGVSPPDPQFPDAFELNTSRQLVIGWLSLVSVSESGSQKSQVPETYNKNFVKRKYLKKYDFVLHTFQNIAAHLLEQIYFLGHFWRGGGGVGLQVAL